MSSKEEKSKVVFILGILLVGISVGAWAFDAGNQNDKKIMSGYDGIVASILSCKTNQLAPYGYTSNFNTGAAAGVDPAAFSIVDPTGVELEIDGKVDIAKNNISLVGHETQNITSPDGKTITHKMWELYEIAATMGCTITTYGIGLDMTVDTTFTVELKQNDFSIFTNANESYAFIMEVRMTHSPTWNNAVFDMTPKSGGYEFPMTTMQTSSLPSWLGNRFNLAAMNQLQDVSIEIKVNKIQPGSFFYTLRSETFSTFSITVNVYLVGYWENTGPVGGWEPPFVLPGLFDWLFKIGAWLAAMGLLWLVPIVVIVVVVFIGCFCCRRRGDE